MGGGAYAKKIRILALEQVCGFLLVIRYFYVLFLLVAVLGTILTSDLGGITNGSKNYKELSNSRIAEILGHSSINTTRIYIMTTGIEHRRKIERLGLVI